MARWSSIVAALRGRPGTKPPAGNAEANIRYATGARTRTGKIDTKAAATDLGVSRRTVQRWLQQGRIPDPARSPAADQLKQQVERRYQENEQARLDRRRARMQRTGAQITVKGEVQVSADRRRRTITVELTGDHLDRAYQALELAGEDAAGEAFGEGIADAYGVPGLEVTDVDYLDL